MSKAIAVEIPESQAPSFEALLDRVLDALRKLDAEEAHERERRVARLGAETRALMKQIRAELNVEKAV